MSNDWEPEEFSENEVANAILNLAAEANRIAKAVDGLLYGLKYSKAEGMSVAEAIEVGSRSIAESIGAAVDGIASANDRIADALVTDE